MDFGRVSEEQIAGIDFTLPADNAKEVLPGYPAETKFYIGLSQKGKFKWNDYGESLNAVEMNGSFYGKPTDAAIYHMNKGTPDGFKFTPKLAQSITHRKQLKDVEYETHEFIAQLKKLKEKLGPIMMTVHPMSTPKDKGKITSYLDLLKVSAALEVRHEDWFTEQYDPELLQALKNKKVATIITDSPGRRDAVHMKLSCGVAFVRFVCTGDTKTDSMRLNAWIDRIVNWKRLGLEECYFFVHADNDGYGMIMAQHVTIAVNKEQIKNLRGGLLF